MLEFYGLEKQNKWAQLGYESLFFIGFTILAWAVRPLHHLLSIAISFLPCFTPLYSLAVQDGVLRWLSCAGTGICQPPEALRSTLARPAAQLQCCSRSFLGNGWLLKRRGTEDKRQLHPSHNALLRAPERQHQQRGILQIQFDSSVVFHV